jgi:hypothetical protein
VNDLYAALGVEKDVSEADLKRAVDRIPIVVSHRVNARSPLLDHRRMTSRADARVVDVQVRMRWRCGCSRFLVASSQSKSE